MGLIFIKLSRNVTNLCLIKLNILLKGSQQKNDLHRVRFEMFFFFFWKEQKQGRAEAKRGGAGNSRSLLLGPLIVKNHSDDCFKN